jgi:large subunit ribosomal protein L5
MKTITLKTKQADAYEVMKKAYGYTNVMQTPKVNKVIVTVGVGSMKDKKKVELVADRLMKITGQKAVMRNAKKSIASFKSREGDPMGYQVTLRGVKMWAFLEKLVHIALPRTKDFRGLPATSMDGMGGYSIGIKEHSIFPEATDEELKDVFGLGITVVTNVREKEQTKKFLELLGFPIKKA